MEEQIGSGTFGKVYSGRIKESGAKIAIKRVQQEKKYKTRELEMVKMLESPFIVKVLGTYTNTEGKCEYLNVVMESYESNFF
jgi:serine/threonine-protein kinase MDS1/RIM11